MLANTLTGALDIFFDDHPDLKDQSNIAVAVSGGPDSMALAHALVTHYPRTHFHLMTVDHGLRPEAKDEAQQVKKIFSAYKNATHIILNWEGEKPDNAILEMARSARYALMNEYCRDHDIQTLFLGHHQDDQAETFLIRLSKGSGLDGLTAMDDWSRRDDIILARPFLSTHKDDLVSYCDINEINYANDPTNENTNYLRPRLRDAMDILTKEGLTPKRLAMTAKRLKRAQEAILHYSDHIQKQALLSHKDDKIILDFTVLKNTPAEISFRLLQNLIEGFRPAYNYNVRMEKLEALHHSLMTDPDNFKPRTLGGCLISLKNNQLIVEKEKK